jgi:23S rRNA (uridine2552-2'-O)-methyltransferase
MKPSKTSKQWMREHINDPFVQMAQKEGYRSRAAYKLLEINDKDHLLKPGQVVVDLGAVPGGWCQVAAAIVGDSGRVIALDLLELEPLRGVTFIQGDFRDEVVLKKLEESLQNKPVSLVISDMAPNFSGVSQVDQDRAMYLAELAMEFALEHLTTEGSFLVKVFQGAGFEAYLKTLRGRFSKVVSRKPKASRNRSSEVYLLGTGKLE